MIIEQIAAEQRTSCRLNEPNLTGCFVFIDVMGAVAGWAAACALAAVSASVMVSVSR